MNSFSCLFFGLLTISNVFGGEWDYDYDADSETGPFAWHTIADACGGDTQSPRNIEDDLPSGFNKFKDELSMYNVSNSSLKTFLSLWDWDGTFIHHFQTTNNGHSIAFVPVDEQGNALNTKENGYVAKLANVFGSTNSREFCFHSFHLHWGKYDTQGSEHTIYGVQYPAEIHFVHYSCDFNNISAAISSASNLDDNYTLAVVGFVYEVDDDADDEETRVLDDVYENIYYLSEYGDSIILPNINLLGSAMPFEMEDISNGNLDSIDRSTSNFWYYKGSLTTPTCNPIVRWHLFDYSLKITNLQLTSLRSINSSHGTKMTQNWRPIQDNKNQVYLFEFAEEMTEDDDSDTTDSSDTATTASSGGSAVMDSDSDSRDSEDEDEYEDEMLGISIAILVILVLLICLFIGLLYFIKTKMSTYDKVSTAENEHSDFVKGNKKALNTESTTVNDSHTGGHSHKSSTSGIAYHE